MKFPSLKSSTALKLCVALATPSHLFAQGENNDFPCFAPTGERVDDAEQLSDELIRYLTTDEEVSFSREVAGGDIASCSDMAIQAIYGQADASFTAALQAAPENRRRDVLAIVGENPPEGAEVAAEVGIDEEDAATAEPAEADAAPGSEGGLATELTTEADADVEAGTESEGQQTTTVENDAEKAAEAESAVVAEGDTVNAAEVETTEDDSKPDAPSGEAAAEAEVETASTVEREGGAGNETGDVSAAEVAAGTDSAETSDAEAAQTDQAVADGGVEVQADAAATEDTTSEIVVDGEPENDNQVGEAGGEQLTDAERQERAQMRAAETAAEAAAAADTDGETTAEAEVETQLLTEADVRKSDEEFETGVASDVQSSAAASPNAEKDGLSDFEKALLLGLGAAVVGSVLNNGDEVVSNSGDRVVVQRDGELRVLKNDDELLRRPGAEVQTQTFRDGSTRTVVTYDDDSQIITVRAGDGTVLRRSLIRATDGEEVVLFDDTKTAEPVDFEALPEVELAEERRTSSGLNDEVAMRAALERAILADVDRSFSLKQVRDYKRVRALAPSVELDAVTFATGSAAIEVSQAEALGDLGLTLREIISDDPGAVFLVEGHTDAVGSASYNLALSDRRAETVALALTEYFGVPPQNLITQGYGETDLKIPVLTDERANRRAAVRNITGLLD